MPIENGLERCFFVCELATILVMLASASAISAATASEKEQTTDNQTSQSAVQEPLTFEHVYGSKRISPGGFDSERLTWLDDERYLQRETTGWKVISANNGQKSDWYDKNILATALQTVEGVSEADAKRMADGGWIESLNDLRVVVFQHRDQLIRIRLDGTGVAVVHDVPGPLELRSLSPTGSGLAFIRKDELWVADFSKAALRQLTFDAGPHVRNGKADWVYFEEVYDRKWQAYRWSPDGLKIAWQQFDDTEVPTFQISDHASVVQSFETEHFPKAGDKNPSVRLGIMSVESGKAEWADTSAYPAEDFILTHFQWLPDSSAVCWFAQNRIQTWLDILVADAGSGSSRRLLRDETAAWVDNPGDVKFLADGSFLVFSERTGWKHLYRVSADGRKVTPITSGDWEVRTLHSISADESSAVVSGTRDSHIAECTYRISLTSPDSVPVRISKEDGTHIAVVSTHGSYFADTWSSLTQPPTVVLRDHAGNDLRVLSEPVQLPTDRYRFGKVELKDVPMADGSTTSAIFIFPPDFDSKQKYPVWLKTYAGPHSPSVKNAWNARLPEHLLANLGIVVVIFDPRTASGYGAKSAWVAYRQLGVEETKDLVSLCDWLDHQGWADSRRIGLNGHSYGGYFTSYAMTHCDRLCAGIAGAPVTDWAHYDTIYTERFMATPQENAEGYRDSSVVDKAANLTGRLLLLHGLKDDNVHPENSMQFVHALQHAGKQFDLMIYPTSRHGIFGAHYNKLLFNFMVEAMGKPEAKQP